MAAIRKSSARFCLPPLEMISDAGTGAPNSLILRLQMDAFPRRVSTCNPARFGERQENGVAIKAAVRGPVCVDAEGTHSCDDADRHSDHMVLPSVIKREEDGKWATTYCGVSIPHFKRASITHPSASTIGTPTRKGRGSFVSGMMGTNHRDAGELFPPRRYSELEKIERETDHRGRRRNAFAPFCVLIPTPKPCGGYSAIRSASGSRGVGEAGGEKPNHGSYHSTSPWNFS